MDAKTQRQLEEAKTLFFSWRLVEAYNILRRYFDRLPFRPEKEHAEYIGMFVRLLLELGKDFDLKFYLVELERIYGREKSPAIAYSLGVVYSYSEKWEAAQQIFESIVRNPDATYLHPKAKMMLANYYSNKGEYLACRLLIDSIGTTSDPNLDALVSVWKAYVLNKEKKYAEAHVLLDSLFERLTIDTDWYAFFSAKVVHANLFVGEKRLAEARAIVEELQTKFAGRHFKSMQGQLEDLQEEIAEKESLGVVQLLAGAKESTVSYEDRKFQLKMDSPAAKLLTLLMRKKFLDKALIVKKLYERQYEGDQDDKLIYYHIYSLRKRLKEIGLPAEAISCEGDGYRFLPKAEFLGDVYEVTELV